MRFPTSDRTVLTDELALLFVALCCIMIFAQHSFVYAQKKTSKIAITYPKGTSLVASEGSVPVTFSVSDPEITGIHVKISTDVEGFSQSLPLNKETSPTRRIPLFKGTNTVELFGLKGSVLDKTETDKIVITCSLGCLLPFPVGTVTGTTEGQPAPPQPTDTPRPPGNIDVWVADAAAPKNAPTIEPLFRVKKASGISKLWITVTKGDDLVERRVEEVAYFDDTGIVKTKLKMAAGKNLISAYDPRNPANYVSVEVTCDGNKCGSMPPAEVDVSEAKVEEVGSVHIVKPKANYANAATIPLSISVERKPAGTPNVEKLYVRVLNNGIPIDQKDPKFIGKNSLDFVFPENATKAEQTVSLNIGKGKNEITVFDPARPDKERASVTINCDGDGCGGKETTNKLGIAVSALKDGEIYKVKDLSSVDSIVTVPKGNIKKIQYDVISPGRPIWRSEEFTVGDASIKAVDVPVRLNFTKGLNTIRIYDAEHPGNENDVSVMIDCTGENCPSDLNVATIVTNSQNTRAIVGLEQAGASTAKSETKPFLNMFFTAPILFDRKHADLVSTIEFDQNGNAITVNGETKVVWVKRSKLSSGDDLVSTAALDAAGKPALESGKPKRVWVRKSFLPTERQTGAPRAGFWGDIRLAATPEQLTTTGVLPSNLVNLATSSGTAGNLVQSFDFLAGVEYRLFTGTGSFMSLIPGIKAKTRFFLAGGLGAISPLDATQENPKFFLIPGAASSQRALFEQRYGQPTVDQTHLALVPLDRDRFLRQWYAGIRLKTFFCENDSGDASDCSRFRNSFPAIFDLMVGQSELVTGGTYKRTEVDTVTGMSRRKHAFVFRLDGFYPLPFREASFIYIYGTAVMKLGGSQRIENFLVLEPASNSPNINDKTVYVPPVDRLKNLQSNREIYKIGIGINLTELFNRNKPK